MHDFELLCAIVNHGKGSRALQIAKHYGVPGGTILLGKGTVKSRLLEILDLNDYRKEIVLMGGERDVARAAAEGLTKEMGFQKPSHGIAFTIPIRALYGTHRPMPQHSIESEGDIMYQAIFTIVDKGRADEVIEAANSAGASGGTIINARGSGIHETQMVFAMPIEPEREIVLILAKMELVEPITSAIREALKLDEPGTGILFIQDVRATYGLFEHKD